MLTYKNFMEIIYRADGGKCGTEVYQRVNETHNTSFDDELRPYVDYLQENLPRLEYCNFSAYLDTNYSNFAEEGYKLGFNDGMRFLVSVLSEGTTDRCNAQ